MHLCYAYATHLCLDVLKVSNGSSVSILDAPVMA
jgi:hypothetical protein